MVYVVGAILLVLLLGFLSMVLLSYLAIRVLVAVRLGVLYYYFRAPKEVKNVRKSKRPDETLLN